MRADDGYIGKVLMQTLDVGQTPVFDVENHGLGMGAGKIFPQFIARKKNLYREMRPQAPGQMPGQFEVLFQNNYALRHITPEISTVVNGTASARLGLRDGWENHDSTDNRYIYLNRVPNDAQAPFRPTVRMVRLEASRFSSAEFQLFLPPRLILCGSRSKAACLLQTASAISPERLHLAPVPEQSFPVAGDTLQIWPTGFAPSPILMH